MSSRWLRGKHRKGAKQANEGANAEDDEVGIGLVGTRPVKEANDDRNQRMPEGHLQGVSRKQMHGICGTSFERQRESLLRFSLSHA